MSARMIAAPNAGKNGTSRPSHVRRRNSRAPTDGGPGGVVAPWGHTLQTNTAPPTARKGKPSHSNTLPSGRSMRSAPPAEVVRIARRIIVRRCLAAVAAQAARLMSLSAFTPPLAIRKLVARYRGRETTDGSYGPASHDGFGRLDASR